MTKEILINTLKCLSIRFASAPDFGRDRQKISREIEMIECDLNEQFGVDWDELEAIEIAAY